MSVAKKKVSKKKARRAIKAGPKFFKCPKCRGYVATKDQARHMCVEPTEDAVMGSLEDELRDAWLKLRAFAEGLGEQRIYSSAKAVMFATSVCYLFVRPKRASLEVTFFLPKKIKSTLFKDVRQASATRFAHIILIAHEDQIEEPVTDWIHEAWNAVRA